MVFPFKDISKTRVTCIYGKPGSWKSGNHDGVDLVSDGDKTVLSVTEGKVIRSGFNSSWGEYVVVELVDGRALVYAHLEAGSRKVAVGAWVKVGQALGIMGYTGNVIPKGPGRAHLHIELQKQYYKTGIVDDITEFLGIKNQLGKVQLIEREEEEMVKRFNTLDDVPGWARPLVAKLIAKGYLSGRGDGGLDLSEDMIRTWAVIDKANGFEK